MKARILFLILALSVGCGKGGTTGGNPNSDPPVGSSSGAVSLQSLPYTAGSSLSRAARTGRLTSDFKFCITKIKLKNAEGEAVLQNGGESIEAMLGLVDVSDSAATTSWGQVTIPVGFQLGEMSVEIHRDPENCGGADYSLRYNGSDLTKDLELKFSFSPAVAVSAGDVLKLGLSPIVTALESASAAGKLNNEQIGEYLQDTVKGTGEK